MKSYSEMLLFESHEQRLEYLRLLDNNATSPRNISMQFYKSHTWRKIRERVIDRDLGFDLGCFGVYIPDKIIVHHINPINENDIITNSLKLTDMDNLIMTSLDTHNRIHYGDRQLNTSIERKPGDTKLW